MQPTITTTTFAALMVSSCGGHTSNVATLPLLEDEARVESLRAEGPAALERLLAQWDAMADGDEKTALEGLIDRVAAQRYATVSRLFWYTDMDAARAAAARQGRPILALRLLGRLDEDYSCANSRYFRVVLYANASLSAFLRESFVLFWSSERAAPRLTIDYGDGRRLERTITGNSIHYLLTPDGQPIDALPGLYAPAIFRAELEQGLALFRSLSGTAANEHSRTIARFHRDRLRQRTEQWSRMDVVRVPLDDNSGRRNNDPVAAERVTVSKAAIELPTFRVVDLGARVGELTDDLAAWAQIGRRLPGVDGPILDTQSRALLVRIAPMQWSGAAHTAQGEGLDAIITRFEEAVLADTGVNELRIRSSIRQRFVDAGPPPSLEALNAWIYAEVFHTPATDPWLGLAPELFTGLPSDGLVQASR